MAEKSPMPLFSAEWGAARGTFAIGGGLSVGVVAIGGNAIGSLVAIGGNAVAPISFGLINSAGIVCFGGVNALGPWALGGVNGMGEPRYALIFALVFAFAMTMLRIAKRGGTSLDINEPPPPWIALEKLVDQGGVWIRVVVPRIDGASAAADVVLRESEGREVTVRLSSSVATMLADPSWLPKAAFVYLRGVPRPTTEVTNYREAAMVMEYEAIEVRPMPEERSLVERLGLRPWTIWNTQLLGSVILASALAVLSR